MGLVDLPADAQGLPAMLADLIEANLEREPSRVELITDGSTGTINLSVTDVELDVGLTFTGSQVRIGEAIAEPDLAFTCDSETLMALTNVPLRFGMPDQMTKEGRTVSGWLMNGTIKVKGLPRHLKLMIRLQRLFSVR